MKNLLRAAMLLFCASCALPTVKSVKSSPDQPVATQSPVLPTIAPSRPSTTQPQLYSRDGTPVASQQPGTVAVSPHAGQTVGQAEGSRWTLLEQYQNAITAKEELEFEANALGAALDQAEAEAANRAAVNEVLRTQLAQYEQRIEQLKAQNIELAERLTTAQVRRLQSEKLLLEAKLDWKRVQAVPEKPEDPLAPSPSPTEASSNTHEPTHQP